MEVVFRQNMVVRSIFTPDQTIRLLGDQGNLLAWSRRFLMKKILAFGIINSTAANPALVIDGAAGQSGNLQEWRDSTGSPAAVVSKRDFGVGTTSPVLPFDSDQPIRAYGASIGSSCSPEGAFGYDSNSGNTGDL